MDKSLEGMQSAAERIVELLDADEHKQGDGEGERSDAVRAAAQRLRQLLDAVPWAWVAPSWIDDVVRVFDPVVDALESYAADPSAAFPVAWSDVTVLWGAVAQFLPAIPGGNDEELGRDVVAFRAAAERAIDAIRGSVAAVEERVAATDERLGTLDDLRRTAVDNLSTRQAELEATITEQATRLDAAIRENQAQFSAAEATNRQQFAALLEETREKLRDESEQLATEQQTRLDEASAQAESVLAHLDDLRGKAERSYQAVGTASVAGFFQNEANSQRTQANIWRIVGVVALAALILAAVAELFWGDSTPSLEHTAARLPIAIAGLGLAGYALRESHNHRTEERRLRKHEVDVSTVEPYLANVDSDEADKLRVDHFRRVFLDRAPNAASSDGAEA